MENLPATITELDKFIAKIPNINTIPDARRLLAIAQGYVITAHKLYKTTDINTINDANDDKQKTLEIGKKAGELRLYAEARLGELIKVEQAAGRLATQGGDRNKQTNNGVRLLSEYGLTWQDSSRAQELAEHKDIIAKVVVDSLDIPTRHAVLKEIKAQEHEARQEVDIKPKGNINLYQGDMLQVIPKIGLFDLIIADPPYNRTQWDWDSFEHSEYLQLTKSWVSICANSLKKDYNLFWFCSPFYSADIEFIFRDLKLPIQSRVIWHRRNMSMGSDALFKFIDTWEMIFHIGNRKLNFNGKWDDSRFDVQTFAVPQSNFDDKKIHPTQKPRELIKILVNFGSYPGDRVLDPFAGSGVTGEVCDGRECILIEKEIQYAELIKSRFQL